MSVRDFDLQRMEAVRDLHKRFTRAFSSGPTRSVITTLFVGAACVIAILHVALSDGQKTCRDSASFTTTGVFADRGKRFSYPCC